MRVTTRRQGREPGTVAEELTKADYEALAVFRRSLRQFLKFSEDAAHLAGLTPQHHQTLLVIKGFPGDQPATVGDLAEWLLIRHHSAVQLTDRLGQAGLIHREHDPNDRRRVFVTLTAEAERLLHGLSRAHLSELRRLRPVLSFLLASLEAVEQAGPPP